MIQDLLFGAMLAVWALNAILAITTIVLYYRAPKHHHGLLRTHVWGIGMSHLATVTLAGMMILLYDLPRIWVAIALLVFAAGAWFQQLILAYEWRRVRV